MRIQGYLSLNKEVELWAKNAVQVTCPGNVTTAAINVLVL